MSVLDEAVSKDVSDLSFPFRNADVQIAENTIDYVVNEIKSDFFPHNIQMRLGAQLEVDINHLPSKLISAFKRTATFANPKFFELQRLRFSTWKTPRYIFCGELRLNHLVLPRGSLDACLKLSRDAGAEVNLVDKRIVLQKVKMRFRGKLSREQERAVNKLVKHENGVLVAPPGIGKTVIACSLIGKKALEEIQEALGTNVRPYILATGSLIGEGFDLPELDTLVLGMPIAFKGRVVQYAGRLHRKTSGKSDVLIYDYLDKASGLTISMFRKRIVAYKKMGYRIETNPDMETDQGEKQGDLFGYGKRYGVRPCLSKYSCNKQGLTP